MKPRIPNKLFISLCIIFHCYARAQTPAEEAHLEGLGEQGLELAQRISALLRNPVNLNSASREIIESLPGLPPDVAVVLIEERRRNGLFISWKNLKNRVQLDSETMAILRRYGCLEQRGKEGRSIIQFRCRLQNTLSTPQKSSVSKYPGPPLKTYVRFRITPNARTLVGLLAEKDPGEKTITDHLVGHIDIQSRRGQLRWLIGDYTVDAGYGLVLWGPYGSVQSADPRYLRKKSSHRIRGYMYSDESHHLKGIASEFHSSRFTLLLMTALTPKDARMSEDHRILRIIDTGYHRTSAEIAGINQIKEKLLGIRLKSEHIWGILGITAFRSRLSEPFEKDEQSCGSDENRQTYSAVGIDFDLTLGRFRLSGEVARSQSGGYATISQCYWKQRAVTFTVSAHHYSNTFNNPHSIGSKFSSTSNKEAVSFSFSSRLAPWFSVYGTCTMKRNLSINSKIPVSMHESEMIVSTECSLSRHWSIQNRFRLRQKDTPGEGTSSTGLAHRFLRTRRQGAWRMNLTGLLLSTLRFRIRYEQHRITYPPIQGPISCSPSCEKGILLLQELRYKPADRLTATLRWLTYDSASYDSRFFVLENDHDGVFFLRSFYGKGTYLSFLLDWEPFNFMEISLKVGILNRETLTTSGADNSKPEHTTEKCGGIQLNLNLD